MRKIKLRDWNINFVAVSMTIVIVLGITLDKNWMKDLNIFMYWIVLVGLSLLIVIVTHLVLFNFGNLMRGFYYKIKGYSFFPFVCYPFCFNYDNHHLKINVKFLRPSITFYDYLPDEVVNHTGVEEQLLLVKSGLYVKQYSRYVLLLVSFGCCLKTNPAYIAIVAVLCLEMVVFSNLSDRQYHGERVKIKNINDKKGMVYLLGLEDVKDISEKDMEKLVALFSEMEYRNYILAGVKRILVESMVTHRWEIAIFVDRILEQLWEKPEEISLNPDEKELDVTILFLYYALMSEDIVKVNRIKYVFESLQREWGALSKLWYNCFQWYLEMIEFSRGNRREFSVKAQPMLLVKTDTIGCMPGAYYNKLRMAKKMVEELILEK